jgi:hypothetical protein
MSKKTSSFFKTEKNRCQILGLQDFFSTAGTILRHHEVASPLGG